MHVKAQTAQFSKYGVRDISRNGNHFDHVHIWDWQVATNPVHAWTIKSNAYNTYICAHNNNDIIDQGVNTVIE